MVSRCEAITTPLMLAEMVTERMTRTVVHFFALIIVAVLVGCAPSPEPIDYGGDTCVYCKMLITERQYGAVLVTKKAKVYKYDSVECMAAVYLQRHILHEEIHSLWTASFDEPGTLIRATDAVFLHSSNLRSPMGLNVSAYSGRAFAEQMQARYGGDLIDWKNVLYLVEVEWLPRWGGM